MIKIYPIRIESGKGYYFINLLLNERAVSGMSFVAHTALIILY